MSESSGSRGLIIEMERLLVIWLDEDDDTSLEIRVSVNIHSNLIMYCTVFGRDTRNV